MKDTITVDTFIGEVTADYSTLNRLSILFFEKANREETEYPVLSEAYRESARRISNELDARGYYDDVKEEVNA